MRFLSSKPNHSRIHAPPHQDPSYPTWPRYASGNVYFSNFFDSVLAQSYFNAEIVSIISSLINPKDDICEWGHQGPDVGEILMKVSEDNPLCPVTQAHLKLRSSIIGGEGCSQNCCFRLIAVPLEYYGRFYVDLFKDLVLNHNLLPVGLYREPEREEGGNIQQEGKQDYPDHAEHKERQAQGSRADNVLPFVLTNPNQAAFLRRGDHVYVLSPLASAVVGSASSI